MRKELKISIPLLKGRLHITYPLISITQHQAGELYLYNYFINMECHKWQKDLNLCYVTQAEMGSTSWVHYLNQYYYYYNFLEEKGMKLHEALQDEINKGNYISLWFDDYFLPCKTECHNIHINMIYGYDTEKEIYLSFGYDNERMLRRLPVPFSAAEEGFVQLGVTVFQPDFLKQFSFSAEHFFLQVNDFLNSQNNLVSVEALEEFHINKNDFMYGLAVYDRIIEHLEKVQTGESGYDLRNLYQLYELSELNSIRIKYLMEKKICRFPDGTEEMGLRVLNKSKTAHNLMLKYTIRKSERTISKAIECVKRHREDNFDLYRKMREADWLQA